MKTSIVCFMDLTDYFKAPFWEESGKVSEEYHKEGISAWNHFKERIWLPSWAYRSWFLRLCCHWIIYRGVTLILSLTAHCVSLQLYDLFAANTQSSLSSPSICTSQSLYWFCSKLSDLSVGHSQRPLTINLDKLSKQQLVSCITLLPYINIFNFNFIVCGWERQHWKHKHVQGWLKQASLQNMWVFL